MKNMNLLSARLKWVVSEKEVREDRRITNTELSKVAGVSRTAVTNWMQDTNQMDAAYARLIGDFLRVDAIWLENGTGKPAKEVKIYDKGNIIDLDDGNETVAIKRVEFKLSAGISGYGVDYLNGDKAPISFRRDWLEQKGYYSDKLYALKVSGHSMETSLHDDDLVVINTADTRHVDGEVYAFNYDGEMIIKRLLREAGQWYLTSDNTDKRKYPNKMCEESCFVIGKVIYKQSERI